MTERTYWRRRVIITSAISAVAIVGLAIVSYFQPMLPEWLHTWQIIVGFILACGLSVSTAWLEAIADARLPSRPGAEPRHEHISGWTVLLIAGLVALIVLLASWASAHAGSNALNAGWSKWAFLTTVLALSTVALFSAFRPGENEHTRNWIGLAGWTGLTAPVRWIGRVVSYLDMVLVHVISRSAAMHVTSPLLRYSISISTLLACSLLGAVLAAPWGFIPLGWVFLLVVALLRRWTFVERDLDVAYSHRQLYGPHIIVGFQRNLQPDVLLACAAILLLLPLTLRQAYMWSVELGAPIFVVRSADTNDFSIWVELVGAEVAKAMPFIDWAEVYDISANGSISIADGQLAHHAIFVTRVVIDIVILGALLQAVGTSAKQAERLAMFRGGQIDSLDPFLERREFAKLVRYERGGWRAVEDRLSAFPTYDEDRLEELSLSTDERLRAAAELLLARDRDVLTKDTVGRSATS